MYTLHSKRTSNYSGSMEKKSATITIRLTPQAKAELVRIARADKRPPAQLAAIIIEEWLEARAKAK
jgi:predicted transcriptional regulator